MTLEVLTLSCIVYCALSAWFTIIYNTQTVIRPKFLGRFLFALEYYKACAKKVVQQIFRYETSNSYDESYHLFFQNNHLFFQNRFSTNAFTLTLSYNATNVHVCMKQKQLKN